MENFDLEKVNNETFESIKHTDEEGNEYWEARELMKVLNYTQWRRFEETIERAKKSCESTKINIADHFANADKMVQMNIN